MSCAPSWTQPEDVPYNVFLFTFGFFLPLVLILLTSWIAISNIRRSCRSIKSDDIKSSALARQYKVVKMVTLYIYWEGKIESRQIVVSIDFIDINSDSEDCCGDQEERSGDIVFHVIFDILGIYCHLFRCKDKDKD